MPATPISSSMRRSTTTALQSCRLNTTATVDGQQLAGILHNPSIPSGLVSVSGNAQYQSIAGRALLQSLVVNGDLASR